MEVLSADFKPRARTALADPQLQKALAGLPGGLVAQRAQARAGLPEFDALRDEGKRIRDHTLARLDHYLELYERNATAAGAQVHWASDAAEANAIISKICREANAKRVTKGKSMVSEEIGLNAHLESDGLEVVETDLGEYILQIRGETPSHIIAPAIHLTQSQVEADFRKQHRHLPKKRPLEEPAELVDEARAIMREKFLSAEVGITGANFLIAETGSSIIVTNEGNGDLTQSLAKTHVVVASIEKVLPTLNDLSTILRLLARSATGQDTTTYATLSTGPRRDGDPDGPENYHVVIVDNGRSKLLGSEFAEVLRCIRCGACMNHCPVYGAVGGHTYGWVYPGPIGAVITPALVGIENAASLPNASTFCGRCADVCPMRIPLPDLMRKWRETEHDRKLNGRMARLALRTWGTLATRPAVYHLVNRFAAFGLSVAAFGRGSLKWLPLAGGWTRTRDLPAPEGRTFQQLWRESQRGVPR